MRLAVATTLLLVTKAALAAGPGAPECPAVDTQTVHPLIELEAEKQGLDVKLALAVADQESASGAKANSPAGARGPMQLMPSTADRYGVQDICDPVENIRAGVAYLKELEGEFGGNVFLMLSAYNAGPERVYSAKGVPPISETVRYVATVANAYYGFDNTLKGGRRSGAGRKNAPAPSGPDASRVDGAGQKWIGGSVLYLED